MTVLFPVSVEDPLAQDRKSIALDESFFSQGARGGVPIRWEGTELSHACTVL